MRWWFDPLFHALAITGFVTVMMLIIEYLNVSSEGRWKGLWAEGRWGQYIVAALLGASPGCLGAFAAVGLHTHGVISRGALIAAMIATTGDESFVMLAIIPKTTFWLFPLLAILGVIFGWLSDALFGPGRRMKNAPCGGLQLHAHEPRPAFIHSGFVRLWHRCSAARGVLAVSLVLFILGLLSGELGPSEWNWSRATLLAVALAALFITATVSDHFIEEHLWQHVFRRHVPRVFLWTFGALVVIHVFLEQLQMREALTQNQGVLLLIASIMGLIPESGPHLVFVTLYSEKAIPFSILLASSMVQDGHGMLPLLAHSRRAFIEIKVVNLFAGLLIGAGFIFLGA